MFTFYQKYTYESTELTLLLYKCYAKTYYLQLLI